MGKFRGQRSMKKAQIVHTLDMEELQPYRTLRRPLEHHREGIFVAEGEKVVRRLLESNLQVVSMLMTPQWHEKLSSSDAFRTSGPSFKVFLAERSLLETIVGFNLHQGIMAVGKVPEEHPLTEVLGMIRRPQFLVALDGLVNAENVGVVVRNCAGFGADAIIVGETSSSPYLRRAVRNSMGSVFQLRVIHVDDLARDLSMLGREYHIRTIAAHPHGNRGIHGFDFSGDICLVFGNEGTGVSPAILEVCAERVAIPMMNETDSLNVASASAVVLYEARKQRTIPQGN